MNEWKGKVDEPVTTRGHSHLVPPRPSPVARRGRKTDPAVFTLEPCTFGDNVHRIFVHCNLDRMRRPYQSPASRRVHRYSAAMSSDSQTGASSIRAFTKRTRPAGLVITPGASADRDHATLKAIEDGIPELPVLRLTLATTSVSNAVKKIAAAGAEFAAELGVAPKKLAYGGRSFGGRSCSVAVAEGLPATALVLLSYPLHPPGKSEKLRTEHFADISVPTLFVSGQKDPFGKPDEFAEHVPAIPAATTLEWVAGNHSPKGNDEIVELVRTYLGY